MNNWKKTTLGEVCDTISTTYKKKDEKIVLINTSDVLNGKVLNHEYVQNVDIKGQFKKTFIKDDILYSEIRPQNRRYAYIDFDSNNYVASTKLMVLRYKENVLPKFLYIILSSNNVINNLQAIAETRSGTFPQITYTELSKIIINLPPLDEQKRIADALSALDDKIEINNKINENLEAQAQAIFKQWFVDFEFPDQEGKPYKTNGGKFIDSELGEIPEGWKVGTLGDVIENFDSKRKPLSSNIRTKMDKRFPYYGAASLMDYVDDYIFDGIYLLIGEDGTVVNNMGFPILQYVWGKFWVNNHAHVIQGKSKFSVEYIYMLLKNTNVMCAVTGAVQPKINQSNLNSLKIIISNSLVLKEYNAIINPFFNNYRNNIEKNQSLSEIRDSLLPKLMSGEVRV